MPLRSSFFFNDTATTEIYTLSLHDALPILLEDRVGDAKRLLHPGPALDDREEALVRDRDQRVDDAAERVETGLGLLHAPTPLEVEGLGDDADGENAEVLGERGDDGGGAGA